MLQFYSLDTTIQTFTPFYENGVQAGFPSPATDYLEERLSLDRELIKNCSTLITRVKGKSMVEDGIDEGDLVVVDKSLPYENGKKIVVWIDGGFTVKKLLIKDEKYWLVPANRDYKPILATKEHYFFGVVTYIIKKC